MQDCAVTINNQKGFECASIRCSFVYARDAEGRHKSGLLPGSLDGEHRHARQLQQAHGKGRSQQPAEQQPTATSTAATLAFLAPFEGARDGRRLFGRELALQEACGDGAHPPPGPRVRDNDLEGEALAARQWPRKRRRGGGGRGEEEPWHDVQHEDRLEGGVVESRLKLRSHPVPEAVAAAPLLSAHSDGTGHGGGEERAVLVRAAAYHVDHAQEDAEPEGAHVLAEEEEGDGGAT